MSSEADNRIISQRRGQFRDLGAVFMVKEILIGVING